MRLVVLAALTALTSAPALAQDPAAAQPAAPVASTAAEEAEAPSDPNFVEYPVWLPKDKPRGSLYPERALAKEVAGSAVAVCTVKADGRLEKCKIESEDPKGFGFGDALITITRLMKMKPQDEDGAPTAGKFVRVPFDFKLPK